MCSDFGEAGFGLLGSRLRGLGVLGLWIWGLIRVEGLGVRFSEGLLGPSKLEIAETPWFGAHPPFRGVVGLRVASPAKLAEMPAAGPSLPTRP